MVGARGFEPPASWSRTRRSSQAEPRPEYIQCIRSAIRVARFRLIQPFQFEFQTAHALMPVDVG